MQTFKAAVSRQAVRDGLMPRGTPIWQRGYYERIIRDDGEHDRIARYIAENPANWGKDRFNR
jgi:REP element-mobilizing transposase RayT